MTREVRWDSLEAGAMRRTIERHLEACLHGWTEPLDGLPAANAGDYVCLYARLYVDGFGPDDVELVVESECDDDQPTWLDYEIAEYGLDSFHGMRDGELLTPTWMLANGLHPGQLLHVEFYAHYYKTMTDYGVEYDVDLDVTVLWAEPASPEDAASAWSSVLDD